MGKRAVEKKEHSGYDRQPHWKCKMSSGDGGGGQSFQAYLIPGWTPPLFSSTLVKGEDLLKNKNVFEMYFLLYFKNSFAFFK